MLFKEESKNLNYFPYKDLNITPAIKNKKENVPNFFKENGTLTRFLKGQNLFIQGSPCYGVYYILEGYIQISSLLDNGDETIIKIVKANEFISPQQIYLENNHQITATALTNVEAIFISKANLKQLMQMYEVVDKFVIKSVIENMKYLEKKYIEKSNNKAQQRLARFILEMSKEKSLQYQSSSIFNLLLSRKQISSLIGVSPETIVRLLTKLKQQQIVDERDNKFIILNEQKLNAIAGY